MIKISKEIKTAGLGLLGFLGTIYLYIAFEVSLWPLWAKIIYFTMVLVYLILIGGMLYDDTETKSH